VNHFAKSIEGIMKTIRDLVGLDARRFPFCEWPRNGDEWLELKTISGGASRLAGTR